MHSKENGNSCIAMQVVPCHFSCWRCYPISIIAIMLLLVTVIVTDAVINAIVIIMLMFRSYLVQIK